MPKVSMRKFSRRNFIRLAATAAAAGPFFNFPARAFAGQKQLKIAKWAHFLPEYDQWFEDVLTKEWGTQHDTRVIVDLIPIEEIGARAAAEVRSGKGHDVFIFPWPPAEYHEHVIDHTEVYQTVASKYGTIPKLGYKSTFNPKTKKHFALADFWIPSPVHYFQDYWGEVGMPLGPVHYFSLHSGGQRIKAKLGIPCGLAFTPTLEGNITLHTLLYAFRDWIQDAAGNIVFNRTAFAVETLKYLNALYQDAGTPEQLTWGSSGNVRAMLARKTSCSTNGISLLRMAEKQDPELGTKIRLQPPLIGTNGVGVTALPQVTNCSAVWNFAKNQEGAKQFLADLIDNSKTSYEKSLGCNFPIYPKTLPDIMVRLDHDSQSDPPYKYIELKDALHWTPNLGVPGFATPAFMEIFNSFVIPRMVQSVLKGESSPGEAASAAENEIQRIAQKWQQA